uniref:Uncharacterized protein n=1 Tax=Anopheles merus TaxID=30066 RepID=A0A182VN70_ANOME
MQQMAGHMNLLSPFVFNQFGPYGAYAQQQQAALMAAATAQGTYINPMAALATQIPHALNGSGQPVNGAIPSLPSPTMPTFNMAAQTPNGQPAGSEAMRFTCRYPLKDFRTETLPYRMPPTLASSRIPVSPTQPFMDNFRKLYRNRLLPLHQHNAKTC